MKIVEVTWIDAWSDPEELTADHAQTLVPVKRRHVGYLLRQSDVAVILGGGVLDKVPVCTSICAYLDYRRHKK
jgi:hypothetical protein